MDRPLSPSQRTALEQLSAVTARSSDPESPQGRRSVELLRASGWDVQAAVSRIYDDNPAYPPAPHAHGHAHAQDAVDEPLLHPSRRRPSATGGLGTGAVGLYYLRQVLAIPLTLLALPASLIYNLGALLLGLIARILRLRGSTSTLRPRNPFSHRPPRTVLSPAAAAEQWVKSVEEATGLARRPDAAAAASSASGVQSGPSSSTLAPRRVSAPAPAPPGTGPRLPRFLIASYDAALRAARDQKRLLMVVLSSDENERDLRFKRDVLCDVEVNRLLEDEDVLVWGGDVGEREAYQVGQTLSYVALPFIAFIALQPSAPSTNPSTASTSSPRLRLLSRLEPAGGANSGTPLTATALHTHLVTTVLPRARPFLARLRALDAQRQADRAAREDAERRVNALATRDEHRVLAVRRREAARREAEQAAAAQRARDEQARSEREQAARRARRWREAKRAQLVAAAAAAAAAAEGADVRVAVRLGDGRRVTRGFNNADPTDDVYAWVECELGEADDARLAREDEAEAGGPSSEAELDLLPEGWVQPFHFRLATTFPRQIIPLPAHLAASEQVAAAAPQVITVGEAFRGLGRTVNLVVDGLAERRRISMSSRGDGGSSDEDEDEDEDE